MLKEKKTHKLGQDVCLRKKKKLVLDSFRGHLMPSVKNTVKEMNIDLVLISSGMTAKLQALYVAANMPFKDHLKSSYSE